MSRNILVQVIMNPKALKEEAKCKIKTLNYIGRF